MNARQASLEILQAVIFQQQTLSQLLPEYKNKTDSKDQALLSALVYGVLREYWSLKRLTQNMLSKKMPAENPISLLLILGAFQLLRLNLGDHGVVNETVKMAHKISPKHKNLVNALLRRIQREKEQQLQLLDSLKIENLPPWQRFFPKEKQEKLAQIQTKQALFTVRLRPDYSLADLRKICPQASENPLIASAFVIPQHEIATILKSDDFQSGKIHVQDASAQRAASLLNPQNQERILDACSAPGGKTLHLLDLAPNCDLSALDSDEQRLEKVSENLQRAGKEALLKVADASDLDLWWDKKPFDKILLDAPCSGSGVLRRHPDIAFLRNNNDLLAYPEQQLKLLKNLWQTLKKDGYLLYCTCSILPAENQKLIAKFLQQEKSASLVHLDLANCENGDFGSLHFPDEFGDGFFYALLQKC